MVLAFTGLRWPESQSGSGAGRFGAKVTSKNRKVRAAVHHEGTKDTKDSDVGSGIGVHNIFLLLFFFVSFVPSW